MSLHTLPDPETDVHSTNGHAPQTKDLDGLSFIGTIVKVEPAKYKESGEVIEGLANLHLSSSTDNDFKVNLSKTMKTVMGEIELPAFTKLIMGQPGVKVLITLWRTVSTPDAKGRQYTNYTAIDAQLL
jgi:hypothetical protein